MEKRKYTNNKCIVLVIFGAILTKNLHSSYLIDLRKL